MFLLHGTPLPARVAFANSLWAVLSALQRKTISFRSHVASKQGLLSLIDWKVVFIFACSVFDASPFLDGRQPLPPPIPALLVGASLTFFWQLKAAFVVIKDPQAYSPWSHDKVYKWWSLPQEEGGIFVHCIRELFQSVQEVWPIFVKWIGLGLKEAMETRYNASRNKIDPDSHLGFWIGIRGKQLRSMLRISVFQELQDDGRLVERLVVIFKCRNQASRIEFQKALGLMVRVHFDILVWDTFFFEDCPNTLN